MAAITAEQALKLNALLEQLDYRQEPKERANRRRAVRLKVRMPLSVFLMSNGTGAATLEIFTRNLSSSGMGFVSRRHFKEGERVVINFTVKDFTSRLILARVMYGRYCSGGLYETGVEFLESMKRKGPPMIPHQWLIGGKIGEEKRRAAP